jgi:hypothetical protein
MRRQYSFINSQNHTYNMSSIKTAVNGLAMLCLVLCYLHEGVMSYNQCFYNYLLCTVLLKHFALKVLLVPIYFWYQEVVKHDFKGSYHYSVFNFYLQLVSVISLVCVYLVFWVFSSGQFNKLILLTSSDWSRY